MAFVCWFEISITPMIFTLDRMATASTKLKNLNLYNQSAVCSFYFHVQCHNT